MVVCAVKDCANDYYGLERWTIPKKEICELQGQGTTLVYTHSQINYLLFHQRLPTKTGGIAGSNWYV